MGREDATIYLPYSDNNAVPGQMRTDFILAQKAFYKALYGNEEGDFSTISNIYEASPLNRKTAARKPGSHYAAADKKIRYRYTANSSDEVFMLETDGRGALSVNGYYPQASLYAQSITNEDSLQVTTFTDLSGKKIMEKTIRENSPGNVLITYYVYDKKGNLAWVIPPKAAALLADGQSCEADSPVAALSFRYTYDRRNRIVEKHLPDREPEYFVYDLNDKPVMSQDALLRNGNRWLLTRYDAFDRVVEKKIIVISLSRLLLQQKFDNLQPSELYDMDGDVLYTALYDHYSDAITGALPFAPVDGVAENAGIAHHYSVGNKIYEKNAVLDETNMIAGYIENAYYYDKKGRLVQTVTKNRTGRIDRTSLKSDFTGNITALHSTITLAENDTTATLLLTRYDHQSRPAETSVSVNGQTLTQTKYLYDPLGKPAGRIYLSAAGTELFRDTLRYNIQGWLTRTQATDALTETTLYSQQLAYYNPASGIPATYSGNISQWTWQQHGSPQNSYAPAYDSFGRISGAVQYTADAAGVMQPLNRNTEQDITYDPNGNILTLKRYANGTLADDLAYAYTGNRLTALTENARPAAADDIYPQGNTPQGTYTYDGNGNLTADTRNNLAYNYNHLGLLASVARNNAPAAGYTWAADGTKLSVSDPDGNGFEYIGNAIAKRTPAGSPTPTNPDALTLESLAFPEGRILKTSNGFEVNYYITDHLGSIRTIVKPNSENNGVDIVEQNDYYPFGEKHKNANLAASATNRFLYNGKEKQTTGDLALLDYGARMYNPCIARWNNTDVMAEKRYGWSPYNFVINNPINRIDQKGMLDDEYVVDKYGIITLLETNQDKKDKLFAMKNITENNKQIELIDENNFIEIEKGILDRIVSREGIQNNEFYHLDIMNVRGDRQAKDLFEFLADNTKVEWGWSKVGKNNGDNGLNIITTSHKYAREFGPGYVFGTNYFIRESIHSHPVHSNPSRSDNDFGKKVLNKFPNALLYIYINKTYFPFGNNNINKNE